MIKDRFENMLDQVKRALIGVAAAVLLALLTILLLAPETMSNFIEDVHGVIRFLIVVVLYGIIGTFGYSRFRAIQEGRQIRGLVVKSGGGMLAELSVDSAREQILQAIQDIPTVQSADTSVKARGGKAIITLNVVMSTDDVSLPEKQKEINQVLNKVVEKHLGLKMAERPMVQISLDGEGTTAKISPPGITAPAPKPDSGSPLDRLGKRLFSAKDKEEPAAEKGKELARDGDDEASGEFWEFLKSTAAPEEESDSAQAALLQADASPDAAVPDEADELDDGASEVGGQSTGDQPPSEEDDEQMLSSSQ